MDMTSSAVHNGAGPPRDAPIQVPPPLSITTTNPKRVSGRKDNTRQRPAITRSFEEEPPTARFLDLTLKREINGDTLITKSSSDHNPVTSVARSNSGSSKNRYPGRSKTVDVSAFMKNTGSRMTASTSTSQCTTSTAASSSAVQPTGSTPWRHNSTETSQRMSQQSQSQHQPLSVRRATSARNIRRGSGTIGSHHRRAVPIMERQTGSTRQLRALPASGGPLRFSITDSSHSIARQLQSLGEVASSRSLFSRTDHSEVTMEEDSMRNSRSNILTNMEDDSLRFNRSLLMDDSARTNRTSDAPVSVVRFDQELGASDSSGFSGMMSLFSRDSVSVRRTQFLMPVVDPAAPRTTRTSFTTATTTRNSFTAAATTRNSFTTAAATRNSFTTATTITTTVNDNDNDDGPDEDADIISDTENDDHDDEDDGPPDEDVDIVSESEHDHIEDEIESLVADSVFIRRNQMVAASSPTQAPTAAPAESGRPTTAAAATSCSGEEFDNVSTVSSVATTYSFDVPPVGGKSSIARG